MRHLKSARYTLFLTGILILLVTPAEARDKRVRLPSGAMIIIEDLLIGSATPGVSQAKSEKMIRSKVNISSKPSAEMKDAEVLDEMFSLVYGPMAEKNRIATVELLVVEGGPPKDGGQWSESQTFNYERLNNGQWKNTTLNRNVEIEADQ